MASFTSRLFLAAVITACHCLTMDLEATNNVIATAHSTEIAIVVRGPHGSTRREELLHVKGQEDSAISLFYSKKSNKVSLEILHGGHLKSVSWGLASYPRSVLILVVSSNRVKLFTGCRSLHSHAIPSDLNLLEMLSSSRMKLYHEENAPVEVHANERAALDALSCDIQQAMQPSIIAKESDVEEVKDFVRRNKEAEEKMQGDDPRNNYIDSNGILQQPSPSRGDIPSSAIESCDDEVIRQLQLLRQTIEHLRSEVADQKGTIDALRGQLRQCCHRVPAPTPPPVERCTGSSCYPGYRPY